MRQRPWYGRHPITGDLPAGNQRARDLVCRKWMLWFDIKASEEQRQRAARLWAVLASWLDLRWPVEGGGL